MKSSREFYSIISIIVLLGVRLVSAIDDVNTWDDFKVKYNKTYASEAEEELRMKIFMDNKQRIESHNTKTTLSFVQGINPFSDLTTEEINLSRNGFKASDREPEPIERFLESVYFLLADTPRDPAMNMSAHNRAWYENVLSPRKLDWRSRDRVSKVKDQGSCGSCWAFSVTGALESLLASRNKSALLSEQNLVDCSGKYGNYGCSGGWMDAAFRYVRDNGIMLSSDYPYTASNDACKFRSSKSAMSVGGSIMLPRGNEPLLRLFLAATGPISVAIDAGQSSFHSYKSGVYNDRSCRNSVDSLNHAVLLVGYGTDEAHGDYWIIKNSWGKRWGDNGYIKIARNSRNLCGTASYAVLPIPRDP